ncbi:MAG: SufD family Fe-S cluster assembly protein [Alphaproteobacteria bacterium]|nr:SufD family Fe-S cluster assembly protein [Alphaproteobacteria bacterium]
MTNSNPFLIHAQDQVVVKNPDEKSWVFEVGKNGNLWVDFLQMTDDLDVLVSLQGEAAKCKINCAYLTNKNNNLNINIKVLHKHKKTTSEQYIRGIVTDESAVSFKGIIEIPKSSQKCDGRQHHRGLILSPKAKIEATPQLEIWADDVICSHGSAVGPLDQNQMFYLQTRGIPENEARKILLSSFLGDLMPDEFSDTIQKWMDENA